MSTLWARLGAWWAFQQGMMLRFWGHRMVRREIYQASAAAFSRVLVVHPDHIESLLARGLLYWRELQDGQRAVADFSHVLEVAPHRAEALFYRGMAYQLLGDYRAAVDDLRAATEQMPDALWRHNAQHQLVILQAIVDDLPPALAGGHTALPGHDDPD